MSKKTTDSHLITAIRAGDKQAFGLLVLKYQLKILHVVSRYVKNRQEGWDVSQEIFINAYRALRTFRGESSFYTWLYRIAINTSKNYRVAQGRRFHFEPEVYHDPVDYDKYCLKELGSPEHLLMRDELAQCVFDVIEHLPVELKQAIILCELEGKTYKEIADDMGCPIGTVRSRIFRARTLIEETIQPLLSQ